MKSLFYTLLITVFLAGSSIFAKELLSDKPEGAIGQATNLQNMEIKHANAWLELMKKYKTKKVDLMVAHNNEKAELLTEKMNTLVKNGFSDQLVSEYTKKCLEMHKRHRAEWRELCKQKEDEIKKLDESQTQEIQKFETMLNASVAPAAAA